MPEQQFEQQPTPEIQPPPSWEKEAKEREQELEKELDKLEKELSGEEKKAAQGKPPIVSVPSQAIIPKTETRRKIEKILSENLVDIFRAMDVNQKTLFKQKGEETASAIELLIQTAKATAKKIIQLISNWLKLIPGVNKYFLEQETKIKSDKILELTKRQEK